MSAIGSVIVMACGASLAAVPRALGLPGLGAGPVGDPWGCGAARLQDPRRAKRVVGAAGSFYQELLLTPGSSPACAISRRQMRHRPNLRKTACGRPQRWQRV